MHADPVPPTWEALPVVHPRPRSRPFAATLFPRLSMFLLGIVAVVMLDGRLQRHQRARAADSRPAGKPAATDSDKQPSSIPDAAKSAAARSAYGEPSTEKSPSGTATNEPVQKQILSGRVAFLAKLLKERDIAHYPDEIKNQVVLETRDGELLPIIPDWRGRAFFQDERLRDRPVDLLVQRRSKSPYLQVLSIYTFDETGARQLTDYWCDICSIPMYEIKDCECCQGPIRLRYQKKELPKLGEPEDK